MSESEQNEAKLLLMALKDLLKARGITYAQLGERLGVSLPTVKRLLNKSTIPLDRLFSVCKIADIEPAELFEKATMIRPRHTEFTTEQDELFDRHPYLLGYFSELFYARRRPGEIARRHGLDRLSTDLYLSQLEQIGLIERQPNNRLRFLVEPPLGFGPGSRILRRIQKQFMEDIVQTVIDPNASERPPGCYAIMKPLTLTLASWNELISELNDLVDRFSFLSEKSPPTNERPRWNLAIAAGPTGNPEPGIETSDWSAIRKLKPTMFRKTGKGSIR
jgi:transcriptional regulator with XRE-family HTH domain